MRGGHLAGEPRQLRLVHHRVCAENRGVFQGLDDCAAERREAVQGYAAVRRRRPVNFANTDTNVNRWSLTWSDPNSHSVPSDFRAASRTVGTMVVEDLQMRLLGHGAHDFGMILGALRLLREQLFSTLVSRSERSRTRRGVDGSFRSK